MTELYDKDPVITRDMAEAINRGCNVGILLNRHVTLEEGRIAGEYSKGGHVIVPELIGWSQEFRLGANVLANSPEVSRLSDERRQTAVRTVRREYGLPYMSGFYRGIKGCGASVEFVDLVEDSPLVTDLITMSDLHGDDNADQIVESVRGMTFAKARRAYRAAYATIGEARFRREKHIRHKTVNLLGRIASTATTEGPKEIRMSLGLNHASTPEFLSRSGIDVRLWVPETYEPTPYMVLERKSIEGLPITELDYARAMISGLVKRAAATEAIARGLEPTAKNMQAVLAELMEEADMATAEALWDEYLRRD